MQREVKFKLNTVICHLPQALGATGLQIDVSVNCCRGKLWTLLLPWMLHSTPGNNTEEITW